MRSYSQLTEEQRHQIYEGHTRGISQTEVAKKIGVNKSTISRELKRNTGLRGYRHKQGHHLSKARKATRLKIRIPAHHWMRIEALIREDWSLIRIRIIKLGEP